MSTNVATNTWNPNNGTSEYSLTTPSFLVDPISATTFIVDPVTQTNFITDTGVIVADEPATVWAEDDSRA